MTTFYPPYNFGGDGICVYRLANELAQRGHHVDVIHSIDAFSLKHPEVPREEYPNHPQVRLFGLRSNHPKISSLVTHQTGVSSFRHQIKQILKQHLYDVIHYHNMSLMGLETLQYGQAVKLYTLHEHWLVCPMHVLWKFDREVCTHKSCFLCTLAGKRPPQWWRYTNSPQKYLKHVDWFLSPSEFTRQKHLEGGLDGSITCLPHFLPLPNPGYNHSISPEIQKMVQQSFFLFVGRLEKIKGVQQLIPIFQQRPNYRLCIVGDGSYRAQLQSMAGMSPNIQFLGKLHYHNLAYIYQKAMAVLVPSVCYEVFGNIVIEAFSMKTPVIVNDLGALPETIHVSGGGLTYTTPEELLRAVDQFAQNPQLCQELGEKGFQAYLKYWTPDAHMKQYFNLILPLLERK